MYKVFKVFTAMILFGCLSSPAFADDQKRGTEHDGPKEHYPIHLNEIVVSTPMQQKISDYAKPVTVLHDDNLRMKAGSTLGETLQQELGVHGQNFGPGAGLPVIRGQDGPRVRVLSNGLGTNDASQYSPDHASTSVPLNAKRIEILRGPAALLYGSGAIGGVVNVIDNRIPEEIPETGLTVEQKFNSVSNNRSTALQIEGGQDKFAYHFDGYVQRSGDIKIGGDAIDPVKAYKSQNDLTVAENTNGFINNSKTDNFAATAGFSYVGDFGFIGFSGNTLESRYQIPTRGSAGAEQSFIKMKSNKLDLKSEWNISEGFFEKVRTKLSMTDYEHTEAYEADFKNDTFEGRIEAPHKPILGMRGVVGFQVISNRFEALDVEGGDWINPATRSNNYAAFATESLDLGPTVAEIGLRIEHANINARGERASPHQSFTPISVSASDLWNIDDQNSIYLGLARSQRAPLANELFFEGEHEATATYQVGNTGLKMETSYNIDMGYKFNSKKVALEINLFHNWVNNYIFSQRTGGTTGGDPDVQYQQAAATFIGYEAQLIYHAWKNASQDVDITVFSDYTRGKLNNEGDVPRIPPLRLGFQVDHRYGNWRSNLRYTYADEQNYGGKNEDSTGSYTLLQLNTHYHIQEFNKADVLVYAKGNNLLNQNIRNSASFLRNFSPEPGIGGEVGIRINY
jgi:iron complex outermembrane receptor protein